MSSSPPPTPPTPPTRIEGDPLAFLTRGEYAADFADYRHWVNNEIASQRKRVEKLEAVLVRLADALERAKAVRS